MLRAAVCVSGGGTNLQAIIDAAAAGTITNTELRSEERRVGKECRSRWSPYH